MAIPARPVGCLRFTILAALAWMELEIKGEGVTGLISRWVSFSGMACGPCYAAD